MAVSRGLILLPLLALASCFQGDAPWGSATEVRTAILVPDGTGTANAFFGVRLEIDDDITFNSLITGAIDLAENSTAYQRPASGDWVFSAPFTIPAAACGTPVYVRATVFEDTTFANVFNAGNEVGLGWTTTLQTFACGDSNIVSVPISWQLTTTDAVVVLEAAPAGQAIHVCGQVTGDISLLPAVDGSVTITEAGETEPLAVLFMDSDGYYGGYTSALDCNLCDPAQSTVVLPAGVTSIDIVATDGTNTESLSTYTVDPDLDYRPLNFPGGTAADLFITEYSEAPTYGSFTAGPKYVEIYNGTGAAVSLSGWSINVYFNANTTSGFTFNLSGSIPNDDVHVLCNSDAATELGSDCDSTTTNALWSGNDAIELEGPSGAVDIVGVIGGNTSLTVCSGRSTAPFRSTEESILVRRDFVSAGNTNFLATSMPAGATCEWDWFVADSQANFLANNDAGSHTFNALSTGNDPLSLDMVTPSATTICPNDSVTLDADATFACNTAATPTFGVRFEVIDAPVGATIPAPIEDIVSPYSATFTLDTLGDWDFDVTAFDVAAHETQTVTITVEDTAPDLSAVPATATAALGASTDLNNPDVIIDDGCTTSTYSWTVTAAPAGSTNYAAGLLPKSFDNTVNGTIPGIGADSFDVVGSYTVELEVDDGVNPAVTTTITVTVTNVTTISGQSLVTYEFDGGGTPDPTPTTTATGINAASFSNNSGSFQSFTGTTGNDLALLSWNAAQYYQWSLTVQSGFATSVASIDFNARRSGSGPGTFELQYSLNGFTTSTTIGTGSLNTSYSSYSFNAAPLPVALTAGDTITFRIINPGATASGNIRIDEVEVSS